MNMKSVLSLFLLAAMIVVFASCEKVIGEGPMVTETRNINNFSGISLQISGQVNYTQSPDYKVEVRAQQNLLGYLETYVSNNRLVIRFDNDVRVRTHEDIVVNISAPNLNSLRVSGSGDIIANGSLTPGSMDIDISGSGNITVSNLETNFLESNISGSGDIKVINGSATEEKLKISGSGGMDLTNVIAKTINTTTSGSGDIRVHATDRLNVTISGSGSVYYKGQPTISTRISGSGDVRPL
jgi:Putative auto-transporter adhesin, head GIN domain